MALTDKQERFAQAIADGMNQADAYRIAYKPKPMSADALYVRAHEVATNSKVAVRVSELKGAIAAKLLWTREQSVAVLSDIARDSEVKASEKVSAVKELNSMHGFNAPTKHELDVTFPRTINVIAGRA